MSQLEQQGYHLAGSERIWQLGQELAELFSISLLGLPFSKKEAKQGEKEQDELISQHSLWRADYQVRRFVRSRTTILANMGEDGSMEAATQAAVASLATAMGWDAEHHARETLLGELLTEYEYVVQSQQVSVTEDVDGNSEFVEVLGGGYEDNLLLMAVNFIRVVQQETRGVFWSALANHFLKAMGLEKKLERLKERKAKRAELESAAMIYESNWAMRTASDPNQYLVWLSYPGLKDEGYHSSTCLKKKRWRAREKHHSFIYLKYSEFDDAGRVVVHTKQIRAWPNIIQMQQIYQQLSGRDIALDKDHPDHSFISNLIELNIDGGVEQVLDYVRSIVYQSQNSWFVHPSELPVVDQNDFWRFQQQLFNFNPSGPQDDFYFAIIEPLLKQIPLFLSYDDPFWNSRDYQLILEQMDKAFSYYHLALEKWVEENNTNPLFKRRLSLRDLPNLLRNLQLKIGQRKPEQGLTKETAVQQTDVDTLTRLYQTDVRTSVFGEKLSEAERKWYLANVGQSLSLLGSFLSLAQCGVLAPFTAPFSIIKAGSSLSSFQSSISFLSTAQKIRLLKEIDQLREIFLAGERWLVPPAYLKARADGSPGCQVRTVSKVENGMSSIKAVAVGPCDIPLRDDPMAVNIGSQKLDEYRSAAEDSLFNDDLFANRSSQSDHKMAVERQTPFNLHQAQTRFIYTKKVVGLAEAVAGKEAMGIIAVAA